MPASSRAQRRREPGEPAGFRPRVIVEERRGAPRATRAPLPSMRQRSHAAGLVLMTRTGAVSLRQLSVIVSPCVLLITMMVSDCLTDRASGIQRNLIGILTLTR